MSNKQIIRAWKDPIYRKELSETERASIPANPAGLSELTDEDLGKISGGFNLVQTHVRNCQVVTTRISVCDDSCTNWPKGNLC